MGNKKCLEMSSFIIWFNRKNNLVVANKILYVSNPGPIGFTFRALYSIETLAQVHKYKCPRIFNPLLSVLVKNLK